MFTRSAKMTDGEKADLKADILKVTQVSASATPKQSKLSAKGLKVQKILNNSSLDFNSSRKKTLVDLMEAVLGEKIDGSSHVTGLPRLKDDSLMKFMAIVPEEDSNSHQYPLGRAVLAIANGSDYCLTETGSVGKHMQEEDCRFATVDEIDALLSKLQRNVDAINIVNAFK